MDSFTASRRSPWRAIGAALLGGAVLVALSASATEPILRPPAQAREVLDRFGVGSGQLESFASGQPLTSDEERMSLKILHRLPRLGLDNLQRWRVQDVTWNQLAAAPGEYRADVFLVRGRVKRVTRQALPPEQSELYELQHFYRVTMDLADSPQQALVLARSVPAAWPFDHPLDEPATADALFLKAGDSAGDRPLLIFAAGRMAWLPERPRPDQRVGASQVELARLGMDAGLWEQVRSANRRGLGDEDREAFYQLLAALSRPDALSLRAAPGTALNVVPLLEHPEDHHGEVLPVEGLARRVQRVPVSDRDVQARFGIDHYYEVDLFVSLANRQLKFGIDAGGKKAVVYQHDFPATLILRRLPPGLAEGENVHQQLRANCVFFKLWTYQSDFAAQFNQSQVAPLFFAAEAAVVEVPPASNWIVAALVFSALVLALAVVGIFAWWQRAGDRGGTRRSAAHAPAPDFSQLGQ